VFAAPQQYMQEGYMQEGKDSMRSLLRYALMGAVSMIGVSMLTPTEGRADTIGQSQSYVFTSDDCSGGCGLNGKETVKVTVTNIVMGVETLDISASMPSTWKFISTGASGNAQFSFALNGIASLTFIQGATTWSTTGWTPLNGNGNSPSATSPQTVSGQTISYPGKGTFGPDGYAMEWNGGNGNHPANTSSLDFQIQASGLTLASLQACSSCADTAYFFADIFSPVTGNTGLVDATLAPVPGPLAGAGLPGLVVACGGLLALARRRRQKIA
jgi:hypothetical protein